MLIVAYVINFSLVSGVTKAGGNACSCPGITLISLFSILTIGNVVWIVYQFIEFGGCSGNLTILIITAIAGFLMYVLVLIKTRDDASMFTSSLVLSYCLYLQWSAMSSNSNATCNPFSPNSTSGLNWTANTVMMMIFGLIFTFSSLFVISATTKKEEEENLTT